jgi:hypothetical protein
VGQIFSSQVVHLRSVAGVQCRTCAPTSQATNVIRIRLAGCAWSSRHRRVASMTRAIATAPPRGQMPSWRKQVRLGVK